MIRLRDILDKLYDLIKKCDGEIKKQENTIKYEYVASATYPPNTYSVVKNISGLSPGTYLTVLQGYGWKTGSPTQLITYLRTYAKGGANRSDYDTVERHYTWGGGGITSVCVTTVKEPDDYISVAVYPVTSQLQVSYWKISCIKINNSTIS